jgi:hypothetical protein
VGKQPNPSTTGVLDNATAHLNDPIALSAALSAAFFLIQECLTQLIVLVVGIAGALENFLSGGSLYFDL